MHKQQGLTQAWEYCQAKPIKTLGRPSQGVTCNWSQCIKSHYAQTSSGKGLPSHFWNRNIVRSILPGLRRKITGVSFIKLSVHFILKVYVCTEAWFCIRVNFFTFIKPCICLNLRKNPFINPSQGKVVRMCISTLTPPRNHHTWSLQRLVLLQHIISMHIPIHVSKVQDIKEIWDPDCNSIWAIAYTLFVLLKIIQYLCYVSKKISIKTKRFKIVDLILLHRSYSISIVFKQFT